MDLNSDSIRQCPRQVYDDFNKFINTPESWWEDGHERGRQWQCITYWSKVLEAAEAGCNTCAIFRGAATGFYPGLGSVDGIQNTSTSGNSLCLACKPTFDDEKGIKTTSVHLNLARAGGLHLYYPHNANESRCSWPLDPLPSKKKECTLDAKVAIMETWLRDCRDNHPNCCKDGQFVVPKLPKRVLDVSPPQGGLRLHETDNDVAGYICLSHRWGSTRPLTTTRSNLEAWKSSIRWESVPRTFQDAIKVTRRLGIRYLWIDSLCIVQDDMQDWEDQAPEMCAIYSNAFLTLSATRCNDSTDTLLPDFRRTVDRLDSHGNPTAVAVRSSGPHVSRTNAYSLLERGWVLQERLLSRRVLHFGFDELMWECMEDAWCECDTFDKRFQPRIRNLYRKRNEPGKEAQQTVWYQVVQTYTELELTYLTDRGVAILGIAKDMELTRKCRYLCGLWEDTLLADLAWWAADSNPSKLPGPTWSWISVSGPCLWWGSNFAKWVDRSTRVEPSTHIPKQLTLQGRCIKGISGKYRDFDVEAYRAVPGLQRPQSSAIAWKWFEASFGGRYMNATSDFDADCKQEAPVPEGETAFWIHLGSIESIRGTRPSEATEVGLVLRCVDTTFQLYERVGLTRHGWRVAYSLDAAESRIREAFLTSGEEMVFNLV